MGFNQKVNLKAVCPEFTAAIQQKPISGAWSVVVTYKSGSQEQYTFLNEASMRRELNARSKFDVKFVREVLDATDASSAVEKAREAMLQQAPRKVDPKALRQEPEQSALERVGYSREESDAIIWACYSAAAQLRPWFLEDDDNLDTVSRFMSDNRMPPTAENFGKAIDEMASRNHLVRRSRKRMDPIVTKYISPSQTPAVNARKAAEQLSLEELEKIERRRQADARKRLRLPPGHIF